MNLDLIFAKASFPSCLSLHFPLLEHTFPLRRGVGLILFWCILATQDSEFDTLAFWLCLRWLP